MDNDLIEGKSGQEDREVITVFIAVPITERPITDPRPGDTPSEVEAR